jgi:quinohemoprotein ethanol dehydrogenase
MRRRRPNSDLPALDRAVLPVTHGWVWVVALLVATAAQAVEPGTETESETDWPFHGRNQAEDRFSPLDQINRETVPKLGLAWSYMTGSRRGLEASPIMVDGVLYATASWSKAFALDARTGKELWSYDPKVPGWKGRHACCDVVNRGVAVSTDAADRRVFLGTIDGRLIALSAKSGEPIWSVRTTDINEAYTITGAPRLAGDLVVIGNGGADLGVRGYVTAYHQSTGEQAWRFYLVPGSKDGPHEHKELEAAAKTWSKDSMWESGLGGTAWDSFAYDAELGLLYVGSGNASVYDREKRSPGGGDNLYLASILALKAETGELVWYYQTVPGEYWDFTATQHMILADMDWRGKPRKVLMQAPKNGFFYVLDRETGELLSAEKFSHVSWATHVDMKTGRPVEREEAHWSNKLAVVAPGPPGAHNWHPMSYSPRTGLVYIPVMEGIYMFEGDPDFKFRKGVANTGENFAAVAESTENYAAAKNAVCGLTRLVAWDPQRGEKAWEILHEGGVPGATLVTAGDLVFKGNGGGALSAYDAETGSELWHAHTGIDVMAPPSTYELDGEQYVVALAGTGGTHGGHVATFDHDNAGRVLAFKLDARTPMPAVGKRPPRSVSVPRLDVSPEVVAQGRVAYSNNCTFCHGIGANGSGLVPDLRYASKKTHDQWDDIVRGGIRQTKGMASFADVVSVEESRAIQAYILDRAWHEPGIDEKLLDWFVANACIPNSWLTD